MLCGFGLGFGFVCFLFWFALFGLLRLWVVFSMGPLNGLCIGPHQCSIEAIDV